MRAEHGKQLIILYIVALIIARQCVHLKYTNVYAPATFEHWTMWEGGSITKTRWQSDSLGMLASVSNYLHNTLCTMVYFIII